MTPLRHPRCPTITAAKPQSSCTQSCLKPRRRSALMLILFLSAVAHAQPVTPSQVATWRTQMRDALYIPQHLPTPAPHSYGTFPVTPTVTAERLAYTTEFGLRVPAILYRPTAPSKRKLPAMLLVDGHGGDKSSWYTWYTAILYAGAGNVVLTYDALGTGESSDDHKAGENEHDRPIETPASMPARTGGRMIADILQGVTLLAQRSDVDPRSIAVLGFSMGSFHAALAGALDPRIHALLLTGGGDLDGPGGYWESSHAIMCQSGPYKALRFLGDVPAVLFTMNARRGDTFIVNGTADTVVDIPHHGPDFFADLRARTIALNGSDKGVFTTSFDEGASHRPNWMTPIDDHWLAHELGFPDPPSLPTESMRAWATRTGYELGKSSGREDRDAGLVMVAAPVPLLTQDQLSILPRAQWDRQNHDFLYSTWVQRALAAAGNDSPKGTP